jgi:hypothetical protein
MWEAAWDVVQLHFDQTQKREAIAVESAMQDPNSRHPAFSAGKRSCDKVS